MPGNIDYKAKYLELKQKFMNSVDVAFRLGFEQGSQQAQVDQAAQQAQQAQDMQAQSQAGMPEQSGKPGKGEQPNKDAMEPGMEDGQQPPSSEHPEGSELDQHIAKLESMLGKSEDKEVTSTIQALKTLRKSQKLANDMKKGEMAIKAISSALHKPSFKMGEQAKHNLNNNAKQSVTLQHKIVNDIMVKMEQEEKRISPDISSILAKEGLKE